jgi:hypothetical protein
MTDFSYEARMEELGGILTALKERPLRELPPLDLPEVQGQVVLDLLDEPQYKRVLLFGVQLLALAVSKNAHGIVRFKGWFFKLDAAQRTQVIDYYNSLLLEYGFQLVWYSRGHNYGYQLVRTTQLS